MNKKILEDILNLNKGNNTIDFEIMKDLCLIDFYDIQSDVDSTKIIGKDGGLDKFINLIQFTQDIASALTLVEKYPGYYLNEIRRNIDGSWDIELIKQKDSIFYISFFETNNDMGLGIVKALAKALLSEINNSKNTYLN